MLLSCSLHNCNSPKESQHSRSYFKKTFPERRQLSTSPSLFTQPAATPLQQQMAQWHPKVPRSKEGQYLRYQEVGAHDLPLTHPIGKGSKERRLLGCSIITALKSRQEEHVLLTRKNSPVREYNVPQKEKKKKGKSNSHARDLMECRLKRWWDGLRGARIPSKKSAALKFGKYKINLTGKRNCLQFFRLKKKKKKKVRTTITLEISTTEQGKLRYIKNQKQNCVHESMLYRLRKVTASKGLIFNFSF